MTHSLAVGISSIPFLSASTATMTMKSLKASGEDTELVLLYIKQKEEKYVLKSVHDLKLYFRIYRLS